LVFLKARNADPVRAGSCTPRARPRTAQLDRRLLLVAAMLRASTTPIRRSFVGATLGGRYRIDARIAHGGFGAIYRGSDLASGLRVALKVLHAELAADADLAARFRREALVLSMLHDPHTVRVFDHGEDRDGTLFIVMELLCGGSLEDRLRASGTLGWRSVVDIVRGACCSLGEAHALGIVHRDLKPANIHLEPVPEPDFVKVLDFGIAKLLSDSAVVAGERALTSVGMMIGTRDYMAPEQLVGDEHDPRTDIYSLGVIAYELLTGRRPFRDAIEVFSHDPVPPSHLVPALPREVDGVVLRCLAREPDDRYPDLVGVWTAFTRLVELADGVATWRGVTTEDDLDRAITGRELPLFAELRPRLPVLLVLVLLMLIAVDVGLAFVLA
jgi:eukaryotic-like serine/threonine-protein kinase